LFSRAKFSKKQELYSLIKIFFFDEQPGEFKSVLREGRVVFSLLKQGDSRGFSSIEYSGIT
jgi:hypothetical protein